MTSKELYELIDYFTEIQNRFFRVWICGSKWSQRDKSCYKADLRALHFVAECKKKGIDMRRQMPYYALYKDYIKTKM